MFILNIIGRNIRGLGRKRGLANEEMHNLLFESDNNVSDLDSDDENKLKSSPSNVYVTENDYIDDSQKTLWRQFVWSRDEIRTRQV